MMIRRVVVTTTLVGLLILGAGAERAAQAACCGCYCGSFERSDLTACSDVELAPSECPACPNLEMPMVGCDPEDPPTCDSKPENAAICRGLLPGAAHAAPALSPVLLAGLGGLLVVGGIWRTRRRRAAAV